MNENNAVDNAFVSSLSIAPTVAPLNGRNVAMVQDGAGNTTFVDKGPVVDETIESDEKENKFQTTTVSIGVVEPIQTSIVMFEESEVIENSENNKINSDFTEAEIEQSQVMIPEDHVTTNSFSDVVTETSNVSIVYSTAIHVVTKESPAVDAYGDPIQQPTPKYMEVGSASYSKFEKINEEQPVTLIIAEEKKINRTPQRKVHLIEDPEVMIRPKDPVDLGPLLAAFGKTIKNPKKDKPVHTERKENTNNPENTANVELGENVAKVSQQPKKAKKSPAPPKLQIQLSTPQTKRLLLDAMASSVSADEDGVHHLNTTSSATTALGRALDLNAKIPFMHPDLGPFNCVGGFWFYIGGVAADEEFRTLYGNACRAHGRNTPMRIIQGFKTLVAAATWVKINSDPKLAEDFRECNLPIDCYYIHLENNVPIRKWSDIANWYPEVLNEIRLTLRVIEKEKKPYFPDFSFLNNS
jgi:hypothetical protein